MFFFNCNICRDGPEKKRLEALARELKVDKQIHFLGYRDDIKSLLSISDCFLFSSFQEGLPRSLMEAMASGLPCVVSNIRGNTDLIVDGHNGFLCPADDASAFCDALKTIISDSNLRNLMRKNNLIAIKPFDVENVKKEMDIIYAAVLK